jgi:hypothetical protein
VTFLLDDQYNSFLGPTAYAELLDAARTELAPQFADLISGIAGDCDTDDPEGYFEDNSQALDALETLFPDDEDVRSHVQAAFTVIEETVSEVNEKPTEPTSDDWEHEHHQLSGAGYQVGASSSLPLRFGGPTSVFDDIDT